MPIYHRLRNINRKLDTFESAEKEGTLIDPSQLYKLRGLLDQIMQQKRLGRFVPPQSKDYYVVEAYEGNNITYMIRLYQ